MTPDKIIVIVFSTLGILATFWYFLMKKEEVVEAYDSVNILVSGGYKPGMISVQNGKTTTLNFTRTDANSCLEEVVLPDFKIKKYLPLNEKVQVSITPQKKGEYTISCGMNMFHGKIRVV